MAVALLVACRTSPTLPPGIRTHESLDAVLWIGTSAEYRAAARQAYRLATARLEQALTSPDRSWTALVEQEEVEGFEALPPAVVLDIDETLLDNAEFEAMLVESGERFQEGPWREWVVREKARAVPGAVAFTQHAHSRGVRLFYVTNRESDLKAATRGNLQRLGFPVDDDGANLLCLGERPGWTFEKSARRALIARTHRVVLALGDNLNDFVAGSEVSPKERIALADRWQSYWGTRWIVIPNPVYGTWEQALYGFDGGLPRRDVLRRKLEALETLEHGGDPASTPDVPRGRP